MDHRIETVLTLIRSDIRCTPTPGEIAGHVKLSISRFYKLFMQEVGTPPARYVRMLRFERARELLTESSLSVKEIVGIVGLHDDSHFVRDFQRMYGMSPTAYRRAYSSASERPSCWDLVLEGNSANKA